MGVIRCPVLVGRAPEFDTLTAMLDRADHDGGLAVLAGEPGAGKSRLAMEIAAAAVARGFTVARGRAVDSASPVPLRPLVEALSGIARTTRLPDAPAMDGYRPVLASLVPAWAPPGEPPAETSPLVLSEAVLRLLTCLAGRGTLLLLDDLQFADPETLSVIEYLADHLAGEPVLCVATLRDSMPSAALDMIMAVRARRAAEVIEVGRLSDADVLRMAAACLGAPAVPEALAGRLLADCDGLPFAVEEILASAISSGDLVRGPQGWQASDTATAGVPTSIAESVRQRLAGLGAGASEVVVAAAVLGRRFDWTLLGPVIGAPDADVLAALQRAAAAQLIEAPCPSRQVFRFRHSLTRDAIVADLLPPLLARYAARAADAIERASPQLPDGQCELAAELHEKAGHRRRAAGLLLRAGQRALDQGALTSAAELLRRARRMLSAARTADPVMLAGIDEALAKVHVLAGDCDQLMPVAERLIGELTEIGAAPGRRAEACLRVARSLSECDRAALAAQWIRQARGLCEGLADPSLGGWADAVAARCAMDAGDADLAAALARSALASAEAAGLTGRSAEAGCEALEVIGRAERVRDTAAAAAAFEHAYQIAAAHDLLVRRIQAMHELGTIEMLDVAGSGRLERARAEAIGCGAVSTAAVIDLQLANALSLGTDIEGALRAARQSQQAARRLRMRRVEAMALTAQACIAATRGDRAAMDAAAAQAEQAAPGDPSVLVNIWGDARVTAAIVDNDVPGAVAASRAGIEHARQERLTAPSMAWGYWALLSTVTGADGRAAVAEARRTGAEVACWNRGCLAYADAVLAGRDGRPRQAAELAEQGRAIFARCAPWWNHILRRLVAPSALADGWGEPAAWLRQAIGELDAAGYGRLASACRGMLRQAGEPVPRQGRGSARVPLALRQIGVTSREMDVFQLIGQGSSNAEIAERLVISPKTVETHVASLVHKAGLTGGRRELIAYAARACAAA